MHLQSTYDIPGDQRLDAADDEVHHRCNPDDLPVPILHHARIPCSSDVHTDHTYECPIQGEAPHRASIVEICRLRAAYWKGPVEGWKRRRSIRERLRVDDCLQEIAAGESDAEFVRYPNYFATYTIVKLYWKFAAKSKKLSGGFEISLWPAADQRTRFTL